MKESAKSSISTLPSESLYPVSVVMEKRDKTRDQWTFTEWKVTGILPASEDRVDQKAGKVLVHEDDECQRYLWKNFTIELLKDGAESYWNNLMASNPALFVVCRNDETSDELEPFLVTANYDEIIGYLEVDDQVFSLSIPPEIYRWLEQFIVKNYVPPERRKRKRTEWDEKNDQTPPPARRH